MKGPVEKVLVIGLDGATFSVIDPMIEQGRLPHLASLIKGGTRTPLKSTTMPNSYPAWASATTGVNPGKHSIFWSLIRKDNNSYPLQLMNSNDIQAKTLWHTLGDHGKKVVVVNVPTEYPPTCGEWIPGLRGLDARAGKRVHLSQGIERRDPESGSGLQV